MPRKFFNIEKNENTQIYALTSFVLPTQSLVTCDANDNDKRRKTAQKEIPWSQLTSDEEDENEERNENTFIFDE